MQYRKMGDRISWTASALGFGCMRLPTKKVLFWKKLLEDDAINLIRYGIDHGINYVDTAWGYHGGKSEVVVGKALQEGYRKKVHLVTKLPMWKVNKVEDFDYYLEKQLERLQTDYLDIYIFHALNKDRFETVKKLNLIKKMEEAKAAGKIKHIGFSFHDNLSVFKEIVDYYNWDMAQIQYNYMDTEIQATTEGLKYAAAKGIAVVIMEPLKGGKIANPSAEAKKIMQNASIVHTPVDWGLQFVWNHPEVAILLSGMGSKKMVDENLASADKSGINKLTEPELKVINQLAELYKKETVIGCTGCEYCMPCPQGVNIPKNFALLNEYATSKNQKKVLKKYAELANVAEDLDTAKTNGNANLCIACGQCLDACPQGIQIPDELERIKRIMLENGEFKKEYPDFGT